MAVPKNRLNPTFRLGFLISPEINVTPFQASDEKSEPTIDATNAETKTVPPIETQPPVSLSNERAFQALFQFAFQISVSKANEKPKTTKPTSEAIFIKVKKVCKYFAFRTPLLLTNVRNTMVAMDTNWAALSLNEPIS